MRKILRIAVIVIALAITPGFTAASVGGGAQWYANGIYINAWSGGPYVNTYDNPALNNDFALISDPHGSGYYELQLQAPGAAYNGWCVGDYGDGQGDARAGMVGCGDATHSPGWGALFSAVAQNQGCNSGDFALLNRHWSSWLGPNGSNNGSPFYENQYASVCYHTETAY